MSFVGKLQERGRDKADRSGTGITLPVGMGFSVEEWRNAYRTFSDGSDEDRNAFEAGIFLFERLEHVRSELGKMGQHISTFEPEQRALSLCGYINVFLAHSVQQHLKSWSGEFVSLECDLSKRWIGGFPGDGFTTEEALSGLVDGAKFPLRFALSGRRLGSPTPMQPELTHQRATESEIVMGRIYDAFEVAWQSVQWSGAGLHRRGDWFVIDEVSQLHSIEQRLDLFRRARRFARDSVDVRAAAQRTPALLQRIPQCSKGNICAQLADLVDENLKHKVASQLAQRWTTTALETEPFAAAIHPSLDLPIGKILDVWMCLALIASQYVDEATVPLDGQPLDGANVDYGEYAYPVSKSTLERVIAECTDLASEQVARVLDRFTFSRGPEKGRWDELWDRPLVPVGDRLSLTWQPLVGCVYTRLIAKLAGEAAELKNAHSTKGHRFEEHVVNAIELATRHSPAYMREKIQVLRARLDPDDKSVGDLDAVLVAGDTAFVLECRTLGSAATAYEYWDVARDLLADKGPQAVRKRDYLNRNPGWIEATALRLGVKLGRPIKRNVAVVVTNSFMFEGTFDAEPYFVHVDTLMHSILAGGSRFGDVVNGQAVEYLVDYFGSIPDPGEALLRSLSRPAKAEMYRRCLQVGSFPVPGIGEGDICGFFQQSMLKFPETGTLLGLLDQCSFARWLKEVPPQPW